jgi:hypothetical protein
MSASKVNSKGKPIIDEALMVVPIANDHTRPSTDKQDSKEPLKNPEGSS